MKPETDKLLAARDPVPSAPGAAAGWRFALPAIGLAMLAVLALHWPTGMSMVDTWTRSETFAHGYLVVPIALFLVWGKRRALAAMTPRPDWLGFALLALSGLGWLVAEAGQVLVVQQLALVAMLAATVVALAGRYVALSIMFPLAFLFFAVPLGEALIPPLMQWTADFTVTALRLTGIPVYREGLFFNIPSGSWSVVEGCSGLRYLIASVTVGTLYAYITYRAWWRRALFVGLSVVVPILANGMRAYMIVMIAHLSDMKLALGIDHYIYGWVFFGVVMLLLFWLGSLWRDQGPSGPTRAVPAGAGRAASRSLMAGSALGAVTLASAWSLYGAHLETPASEPRGALLASPTPASGWQHEAASLTDWRPRYSGAKASAFEVYRKGNRAVAVYLGYYRDQRQDAELVNSQNVMVVQKHPVWSQVAQSARTEEFGKGATAVRQTQLRSARQRLLIWDWYRISGSDLSNPYIAKAMLARDRLLGRGDDSAAIILATPYEAGSQAAEETLREFVREMMPSIDAALAAAMAKRSQ